VCKTTRSTIHDSFLHEFEKMAQITTAVFDSSVKVPKLQGLIISHTGVVEFLMDYVPSRGHHLQDILRGPLLLGPEETDDPTSGGHDPSIYNITQAQKDKWARQIEHTLKALHNKNILWVDMKTSNVLIDDTTDDAWVVDFGGGNTFGWVDRELAGMVEGDFQGMEKIKGFLSGDVCI
jgi:hypothetical protein